MKHAPGEVGITTWRKPFWPIISWCKSASSLKKSPALTTAQARQLIASIIDEEKNGPDILDVIDYRQRRNQWFIAFYAAMFAAGLLYNALYTLFQTIHANA